MGMTIDEAVSWMLTITEHEGEDITIYDSDVEAINIAISTMRKYQKIEQIVNAWDDENAMILAHKIKKVIKSKR